MKQYALIALMLATSAFADKRIDEIKKSALAQGLELTFEMSPEGFKYAKGLVKPLGGKARVKKDKSFLHAEDRVPALVAQLVAAGAAIHAVMPSRSTLEERFLALLGHVPERTGTAS